MCLRLFSQFFPPKSTIVRYLLEVTKCCCILRLGNNCNFSSQSFTIHRHFIWQIKASKDVNGDPLFYTLCAVDRDGDRHEAD